MSKREALKLLAGLDNPDILHLTPIEFIYRRGEIYINLVLKKELRNLNKRNDVEDTCE